MNLDKEKAVEAFDALVADGYSAQLLGSVIHGEVFYRVTLTGLGFDAVDMRHLCDLAEARGLVLEYHRAVDGFLLAVPTVRHEAVHGPRRHPAKRRPVRDSPQA